MNVYYGTVHWKDECFYIGATEEGLIYVGAGENCMMELKQLQQKYLPQDDFIENNDFISLYRAQLINYLKGNITSFQLNIIPYGTTFQKLVWDKLQEVTYGNAVTYTYIAEAINYPKAVRAVANAIGQNPLLCVIPCHRVIRKDGSLSGFRAGLPLKKKLLTLEGVHI